MRTLTVMRVGRLVVAMVAVTACGPAAEPRPDVSARVTVGDAYVVGSEVTIEVALSSARELVEPTVVSSAPEIIEVISATRDFEDAPPWGPPLIVRLRMNAVGNASLDVVESGVVRLSRQVAVASCDDVVVESTGDDDLSVARDGTLRVLEGTSVAYGFVCLSGGRELHNRGPVRAYVMGTDTLSDYGFSIDARSDTSPTEVEWRALGEPIATRDVDVVQEDEIADLRVGLREHPRSSVYDEIGLAVLDANGDVIDGVGGVELTFDGELMSGSREVEASTVPARVCARRGALEHCESMNVSRVESVQACSVAPDAPRHAAVMFVAAFALAWSRRRRHALRLRP